jgi:hypothetical protein
VYVAVHTLVTHLFIYRSLCRCSCGASAILATQATARAALLAATSSALPAAGKAAALQAALADARQLPAGSVRMLAAELAAADAEKQVGREREAVGLYAKRVSLL